MKSVLKLYLIFILTAKIFAQNPVEVKLSEASVIFSIGPQPAISSEFTNVSQIEVMRAFEKHMKHYKAKVKSTKRETIASSAKINSINNKPINVFCAYKEESFGKKITAYFAFNINGTFISSDTHPSEFEAARQFVYDFTYKFYNDQYALKLKNAFKDLKNLEKENKNLLKEKAKLEKAIDKNKNNKEALKKAELLLIKNKSNLDQNKRALENQKQFIQKNQAEGKLKN
ncbi:MAG: hypothetical protein ACK4IK_02405 [Bacteroidia bacterium]